MQAVESATGFQYFWSIATQSGYLRRLGADGDDILVLDEGNTWWIPFLRDLSFGTSPGSEEILTQQQLVLS